MSLFDLETKAVRETDMTQNYRLSEYPAEGGATSGQLKFRFNSSESQWWLPASTFLLLEFAITKTGGVIASSDNVNLCENPGAAAMSGGVCTHFINGVACGSSAQVGVAAQMYNRAFMSKEVRESIGDISNLTASRTTQFVGNNLKTVFRPPLGLYQSFSNGICGGSHMLQCQVSSNLVQDMIAAGRSVTGLSVTLVSANLMVAHVSPQSPVRPPSTAVLNLTDLAVQSGSHSISGSATQSFSVPASTRKILIASQRSDLSNASAKGQTNFSGCAFTSGPTVSFAGTDSPTTIYDADSHHRRYIDLYQAALTSGRSVYSTLEEHSLSPLTLHSFPKSADSIDTQALVRFTANGNATPSSILVGAVHDTAVVLNYGADGQINQVSYSVVS